MGWLRFRLAIVLGKLVQTTLRLSGSEAGTFPGLVAQTVCPTILRQLAGQCSSGITLVTGTNGKTTTCRLLVAMLGGETKVITNRSGSNLIRGQVSALLSYSSWSGRLAVTAAVLETDEAVLPAALIACKPKVVVLHNLFRDQLDRYGEVNSLARSWLQALRKDLPADAWLIANADDPNLVYLTQESMHVRTVLYGLDDVAAASEQDSPGDAFLSPASGMPLRYSHRYFSHLGDYSDGSGFSRPYPQYPARHIRLGQDGQASELEIDGHHLRLPLLGLYNVYNAVASVAAARQLDIGWERISSALESAVPAFGRFERVQAGVTELTLCLIKNPAGATEVLREIARQSSPISLCIAANDHLADGTDVYWYWDTRFELVAGNVASLTCCGNRAMDMALRLKYAGYAGPISLEPEITAGLDRALDARPERLFMLTTYTASLAAQRILAKRGIKSSYWKE